jgi:hypothetical protein
MIFHSMASDGLAALEKEQRARVIDDVTRTGQPLHDRACEWHDDGPVNPAALNQSDAFAFLLGLSDCREISRHRRMSRNKRANSR